MKKNKDRIVATGILLICFWLSGGMTAFAVEGENLRTLTAAVFPQTGGFNALVYTSVGVVLAGLGFMVRKKI